MPNRWITISILCVLVAAIVVAIAVGRVAGRIHRASTPQGNPVTKVTAVQDIRKAFVSDPPQNIRIVHIVNKPPQAFAFAVFLQHGQTQYAVADIDASGSTVSSFSPKPSKNQPLRFMSSSGKHNVTTVFGVVLGHPNVVTVVLVFPNGQVVTPPVSHHLFWYVGHSGSAMDPRYAIGITKSGGLVRNGSAP